MNKFVVCLMLFFSYSYCTAQSSFFIENKGQIKDQFGADRADVHFTLQNQNRQLFITDQGFSIQTLKMEDSIHVTCDRIDYSIEGFNPTTFIGSAQGNYFETVIRDNQTVVVNSFSEVVATDTLSGIKIKFYSQHEGFKYDIILSKDFKGNQLKVNVGGAAVTKSQDELLITFADNKIQESMPEVYLNVEGKKVPSAANYELIESGYLINIDDVDVEMVIDPFIFYSTYYGGSFYEIAYGVTSDSLNNSYLIGTTSSSSNIATVGAYQTTYVNTGNMFITKFNEEGQRLWGTYFASSGPNPRKVEIDPDGNIYLSGVTGSGQNLGTPGTHQTVFGGDYNDCFLAKFTANGFPIWSTLYGGEGNDILNGMALGDNAIYLTGYTGSHTQIATPGAFQETTTASGWMTDGYIAKFDTIGNLEVATYVGGYNGNKLSDIKFYDNALYAVGAFNTWDKGTPGTYLSSKTSNSDLFFTKFDENLNQIWGSYFTGNSHVEGYHKIAVNKDRIYVTGYVNTSNGNTTYTTSNVHKEIANGGAEIYIEVFDTSGTNWINGTFFGGMDGDYPADIEVVMDSVIVVTGHTVSLDQIATNNVHKNYFTYSTGTSSLNNDVFVTVFNDSLEQIWGSYFGGEGVEIAYDLDVNSKNQLLIAGRTTSQTGISYGFSHQSFNGGVGFQPDAFFMVFDVDYDSVFTDPFASLPTSVCPKENLTIPFEVQGTYFNDNTFNLWLSDEFGDFSNATLLSSVAAQNSGSFSYQIPYLVSGGNYKFRVDASSPHVVGLTSGDFLIENSPLANFNYQIGSSDVYFTDASNSSNSWSWNFDDGGTSIDQDPIHIFSNAGMYNVSLVATNATCSDTAYHQVLIEEVLGTDQIESREIKVFPNPSSGSLNLLTNNFNGFAEVSTLDGKFVMRKMIKDDQTITLELEKGIYSISFINTNGEIVKVEKVIQL